jgi:hypothetical protein
MKKTVEAIKKYKEMLKLRRRTEKIQAKKRHWEETQRRRKERC